MPVDRVVPDDVVRVGPRRRRSRRRLEHDVGHTTRAAARDDGAQPFDRPGEPAPGHRRFPPTPRRRRAVEADEHDVDDVDARR